MSDDGCGRRLLGARCMLERHTDQKHQFLIAESVISSLEAGVRLGQQQQEERRRRKMIS